ncbi:kinase-like domain-containing protein [Spinellus fusiger]|nr:kinase-like domain-containing protein [Spinellus fusiger]
MSLPPIPHTSLDFSASMLDRIIDKRYQLLEELGRGSYGCLFLGQCLHTHSYVAVKVLSKAGLDTEQQQLQHLEIDIQSSLHHPHILSIHQTTQDDDYIFMVMDLCDQGDLFDFVTRDTDKLRDELLVRSLFDQILQAIDYMHSQHVYHRDIKLENILLTSHDTTDHAICKVADFGLATTDAYSSEFGCGSTTYLGPEHFEEEDGPEDTAVPYSTAASDVWSLGILLIALLFGRNPWEEATSVDPAYAEYKRHPSATLTSLFPHLSPSLCEFLQSVLAICPAERPTVHTMRQMLGTIEHFFQEYPEEAMVSSEEYLDSSGEESEEYLDYLEEHPKEYTEKYASNATLHDYKNDPRALPKTEKASFDSAIFSVPEYATTLGGGGGAWSDQMEEEEIVDIDHDEMDCSLMIEEDTDMFVHSQEKESWWL